MLTLKNNNNQKNNNTHNSAKCNYDLQMFT